MTAGGTRARDGKAGRGEKQGRSARQCCVFGVLTYLRYLLVLLYLRYGVRGHLLTYGAYLFCCTCVMAFGAPAYLTALVFLYLCCGVQGHEFTLLTCVAVLMWCSGHSSHTVLVLCSGLYLLIPLYLRCGARGSAVLCLCCVEGTYGTDLLCCFILWCVRQPRASLTQWCLAACASPVNDLGSSRDA